jgi:hypothetical protein
MKDAPYFPHDANARTDARILELRAELGWEGYGLWWAIVEQLREASDYRLSNSLVGGLAMGLSVDKPKLRALLDLCLTIGLLELDGDYFFSPSLRRRLVALDGKRAARVDAARKAAEQRWQNASDANAMRTHSEGNADAMPIDATLDLTKPNLTIQDLPEEETDSLRSSDAATAAALPEKKIEQPESEILPTPDQPAPEKPPGGATDVPTPVVPMKASRGGGRAFTPPNQQQVQELIAEKRPNNPGCWETEAERFVNYYNSNGWKVGRNAMKDWKSAVYNWLLKVPKDGPAVRHGTAAVALPPQQFGTAYGRPAHTGQVATRTAAIVAADAAIDAMYANDPLYRP